jgi:hypothetical protein
VASGKAESDVEGDETQPAKEPDQQFVGRAGADDVGYAEETGAERRADPDGPRDQVDEESDDSFPASDPPANY